MTENTQSLADEVATDYAMSKYAGNADRFAAMRDEIVRLRSALEDITGASPRAALVSSDERAKFEAWRETQPWYVAAKDDEDDEGETVFRLMNIAASEAWSAGHRAALAATPLPAAEGWQWVPKEPTAEMLDKGQHVSSEWLNDNAPVGERRYRDPAKAAYCAMLAAAPSSTPATQPSADRVDAGEPLAWLNPSSGKTCSADEKHSMENHQGVPGKTAASHFSVPLFVAISASDPAPMMAGKAE